MILRPLEHVEEAMQKLLSPGLLEGFQGLKPVLVWPGRMTALRKTCGQPGHKQEVKWPSSRQSHVFQYWLRQPRRAHVRRRVHTIWDDAGSGCFERH